MVGRGTRVTLYTQWLVKPDGRADARGDDERRDASRPRRSAPDHLLLKPAAARTGGFAMRSAADYVPISGTCACLKLKS